MLSIGRVTQLGSAGSLRLARTRQWSMKEDWFVTVKSWKFTSKGSYDQNMNHFIDEPSGQIKVFAETVLALLMLVVSMPIILIAAVLVRMTSRGPAIHVQKRLGRNGLVFTIYKIRTMYRDSEPDGARWCVPGDPRVTPVGRLLRWTHIDELPQLVNVLQGKMSLIGPRPERPEIVSELEKALPGYRRRLDVRPGLTGLAQLLQPPDTDLNMVRSKLAFDLHYVDQWSLWLDLRILLATVPHLLSVRPETIARLFRFPQVSNPAKPEVVLASGGVFRDRVGPALAE
jgi:lipopolysaccharide/colanic/teichoic acid biosynthesis glycosyltransferase